MPTFSVVSSKGGAGKTTTCLLLAMAIADREGRVCVIDADPQQHSARWFAMRKKHGRDIPEGMHVIENAVQKTAITNAIQTAQSAYPFVLIDVQGSARGEAAYAVASADFVVIPMALTELDAEGAVNTIGMIAEMSEEIGRPINYGVLLSRTSAAIRSQEERAVEQDIDRAGVPRLNVELIKRAPFQKITSGDCPSIRELHAEAETRFSKKMTKANLEKGAALGRAVHNVSDLLDEVLERIGNDDQEERAA